VGPAVLLVRGPEYGYYLIRLGLRSAPSGSFAGGLVCVLDEWELSGPDYLSCWQCAEGSL